MWMVNTLLLRITTSIIYDYHVSTELNEIEIMITFVDRTRLLHKKRLASLGVAEVLCELWATVPFMGKGDSGSILHLALIPKRSCDGGV